VGSKNLPCVRHLAYTVNMNGIETEVQLACSRSHMFKEAGQECQPDFLDSRIHALPTAPPYLPRYIKIYNYIMMTMSC